MDNLIHDIKSTVNSAVKKSGDLLELGKIKLDVSEMNAKLSELYQGLGELYYNAKHGDGEMAPEAESMIWEIEELLVEIEKSKAKMAELKCQKVCPSCGKANTDEAQFCIACGEKMEEK